MPSQFEEVQAAEVASCLERYRALGLPVSDRFLAEVQKPGQLFMMTLALEDEFSIWFGKPTAKPAL